MVMLAPVLAVATALAGGTVVGPERDPANDALPTVRDIVETADISGLAISPDGRWLAFRIARPSIERNDYDIGWYVVPANGSAPARRIAGGGKAQFTDAGILAVQTPLWSPDSSALYFLAVSEGGSQVWIARTDRADARRVTTDPGNIVDFVVGADGRTISYRAGATRDAIADASREARENGTLIDPTVDIAQPLAGVTTLSGERVMHRFTGRWFSRGPLLWDAPIRSMSIDITTGATVQLPGTETPPAPSAASARVALSITGDRAEVVSDADGRRITITRASGARIACGVSLCRDGTVRSARWLPGKDALILNVRRGPRGDAYHRWAIGSSGTTIVAQSQDALDGGRPNDGGCVVSVAALFCVQASAASPPRLVRIAFGERRIATLDDPNHALRSRMSVTAQAMAWQDARGRNFSGVLLSPRSAAQRAPLVIDYYHCGGFLRGGVGTELPILPLAARGTRVLCIEEFTVPGPQDAVRNYTNALEGVRAAVDMLAARGLIDRRRVGMAGLSFGSEITMWTALHSDLLAAASIASFQLEDSYFWPNALPGRDVPDILSRVWGLGNPDIDPASWDRVSPARNTARLNVPLLMQLPESEARWSSQLHARLQRAGKPVELYGFADEPHILTQPRHQAASFARTLDWFRFWLSDEIDPDPVKAAQFVRWQSLRRRLGVVVKS